MTTLHGIEVNVGDKVWDSALGWVEVERVERSDEVGTIKIGRHWFTESGAMSRIGLPCIFWQEFEIPSHAFEKPKVMVKKYLVLYKLDELFYTTAFWEKRYFVSEEDFYSPHTSARKFVSLIMESEMEFEE